MKKKIIIGSILTVIILMMLPSISAVEFNTAVESNKAQILDLIRNMNVDVLKELKEKLKVIDVSLPTIIALIVELILILADLIYVPILFLAMFLLWIKGVNIIPHIEKY